MDGPTLQAAYVGLKFAIETLRTVIGTKTGIAADSRIADALDKLGGVQDTLFELRNALSTLQDDNRELKDRLHSQDAWQGRAAEYALFQTSGGAIVWRSRTLPEHYSCPACFEARKINFLQDTNDFYGMFNCPGCEAKYKIKPTRPSKSMSLY